MRSCSRRGCCLGRFLPKLGGASAAFFLFEAVLKAIASSACGRGVQPLLDAFGPTEKDYSSGTGGDLTKFSGLLEIADARVFLIAASAALKRSP
jgi:hypothetical protein